MAVRSVTSTLLRPDGSAWAGGRVRFKLTDDAYTLSPDATYPIRSEAVDSDSNGEIAATLACGIATAYEVTLPDEQTFNIYVPCDDLSPISLETLRAAYAGGPSVLPDLDHDHDGEYLPIAGGTLSGNVTVATPSFSEVAVTDPSGVSAQVRVWEDVAGGVVLYTVGGATGIGRVNNAGALVENVISWANATGQRVLYAFEPRFSFLAGVGARLIQVDADGDLSEIPEGRISYGNSLVINNDGGNVDTRIEGDTDANLFMVDAGEDSVGIGTFTPTAWFHIGKAGTASQPPFKLTSGTNLSTAEVGAVEYDGANLFHTANVTSGRAAVAAEHAFRLTANGSALGPAIADYFGAASSLNLPASSSWELEAHLYFLKSTNGTVVYTIQTSAADYTNIAASYIQTTAGGIAANGTTTAAGIVTTTTAAAALPATASLSGSVNHYAVLRATIDTNAAGNIRIRCTSSTGTLTPLRGSYYKVRRIPASAGTFVA